jgi:hypothetical protein
MKKSGKHNLNAYLLGSLFLILSILTLAGTASAWMAYDDRIVGIRIDTFNDDPDAAVVWVDSTGATTDLSDYNFDNHVIWGNLAKVVIDPDDNSLTYGTQPRGDGLDLSGASGLVMVQVPKFYVKTVLSGDYNYYYISPTATDGYTLHPAFYQRGGVARDWIYLGAYEAGLRVLSNGSLALDSASGVQPWTGYSSNTLDGMFKLGFTSGTNAPSVGDTVEGTTSGSSGILVDYHVSSGSWAGNDAAGTLYLRQCDGTFTNAESLTFASADTATANGGIVFDIDDAEAYGNNLGVGWGAENFWTYSAMKLLYYVEYANLDSQTAIGSGVTDLVSGTGYAGLLTGANGIDSNVATSGTGQGTGTDGETPVAYRNWNDAWGNAWEFNPGYTATDAAYNVLPLTGTTATTIPSTLTEYTNSTGAPLLTDGYYATTVFQTPVSIAFLPETSGGSESTYFSDHYYAHDSGETNILLSGGCWIDGRGAGVGCLFSYYVASFSGRSFGARPEFTQNATRTNNLPEAGFAPTNAASSEASEYPYTIDFNSTTTTDADWYYWEFGDGTTSTDANPTHSFTANGTYPVTLTVGTDDGQWDQATGTVTYNFDYSSGSYGASALSYTINQNSAGLEASYYQNKVIVDTPELQTTVSVSNTTAISAGELKGTSVLEWREQAGDGSEAWSTLANLLILAAIIGVISLAFLYLKGTMDFSGIDIRILIGVAIGALILIAVLMFGPLVGNTIDDVATSQTGEFTLTFNDQPIDSDKITITYGDISETYEFSTDGEITEGNIRVVPAPYGT